MPTALENEILIGRDPDCSVVLHDEGVSRKHARIWRDEDCVFIEDLGSRNGTCAAGSPVRGRVSLHPGQTVQIGRTFFVLTTEPDLFGADWRTQSGAFIGGPCAARVREFVQRFAATGFPVLLIGETGTGKELVAQEIHRRSGRIGSLVPVNCAAIPDELFEAELFGFRRGAFTGATTSKRGLVAEASGGTLFLDEVGELSGQNQAKLLRVLETGESRPLGSTQSEVTDLRVLSATNRRLDQEVEAERFRADLYQRLNGVALFLPPLRERPEDIVLLSSHFLRQSTSSKEVCSLDAEACAALLKYSWPGNVRELVWGVRTAAHRAASSGRTLVTLGDLPEKVARPGAATAEDAGAADAGERDARRGAQDQDNDRWERVCVALRDNGGNVARTAKALGLHRAQIYTLLRERGRKAKEFRS